MNEFEDLMAKMANGDGSLPFGEADLAKELGLTEDQINGFKAMFPKLVAQFLQGGLQFAEDEKRLKEADEHLQKQIGDLLAQNIGSQRSMFLTLTGLSLTVIGAVISVRAASATFFKYAITLNFGIGLLAICIVASILYLLNRLSVENRALTKRMKFQQDSMAKMRELIKTSFKEKKSFDEYFEKRKGLVQKISDDEIELLKKTGKQSKFVEYIPAIICYSFLGGLLLIGLALL